MYNWDYLSLTRFLLAFIVLASHFMGNFEDVGILFYVQQFGAFEAILGFLLISGFSIGMSIKKNQESYFYRRAQRIYPVYFTTIVLHYVLFPETLSPAFIAVILLNVFFLNQLFTSTSYIGPAWSLSLEVWLYALAPLLLKRKYKTLLIVIYTSFILYSIYTCCRTLFHWPYHSGTMFGTNLFTLAFIWIAGFVLAVHSEHLKQMKLHIALLFIAHFCLVFLIQTGYRYKNGQIDTYIHTDLLNYLLRALSLFFIYIIVLYNYKLPVLSLTAKKIFNFLGNISYPLYLIHLSIINYCLEKEYTNWIAIVVICLAISCFIYISVDFYSKKRKVI